MCLAPATQAATTISGELDTNAPLVIDSASEPVDPVSADADFAGSRTVAFVQRMPVTKTVSRVTVDDLASASSCATPVSAQLYVREHLSGDFSTSNQIAYSTAYQSLPASPGKLSWTIPPTTLRKGRSYSFLLGWSPSGCRYGRLTTWGHNLAKVDGGSAPCTGGAPAQPSGSPIEKRMWHSAGASDRNPACASSTASWAFDPTMPQGWLMTNGNWVFAATGWDSTPTAQTACGATAAQGGARVVFWRPNPSYPSTRSDYVCMWPQYEPVNQTKEHGWYHGIPWKSDGSGAPRDTYLKLDTIDYDALLSRYLPQLRFHFAESYRADSAWTATLPLPPFSGDPDRSNNLERENGAILAAADSLLGYPPLTLDGLPARATTGPELYPSGEPALDSDRIDFRNDTYQDDAAAMHANSGLANSIYSRAAQDADGKTWLQYWFFYYYNDAPLSPPLIGDHEADWEMIEIGLNGSLTPDVATYAQHTRSESCPWDRVPKYNGPLGVGPVAFVEIGSHASLFYAPQVESYDAAAGSERVRPTIEQQIGNAAPGWANWRGRWGGSDAVISSPGGQGAKWDDPSAFNNAAGPCPAQASGTVTARRGGRQRLRVPQTRELPAPQLSAKRSGRRALIRYRYSRRQWKRLPRRVGLVFAVRGNEKGSLPRNVIFRLRNRTGRRRLRLPQSPGPYVVQGQTLAASGAQSRPVTVRLQ